MLKVDKNLQSLQHNMMRRLTLYVHYEADAARIVFMGRIV